MRVPISYALHHPERADVPVPALDLAELGPLTFEAPDTETFACLRLAREAARAGRHRALRAQRRQRGRGARLPRGRARLPRHRPADRARARRAAGRPVRHFSDLYTADAEARELTRRLGRGRERVSWLLAFVGFALLVILHELGHFTAAKSVGMRVERFSLFFPPLLARKKVGETEYAIGAIPLGGYVKISGMNPDEDLPDEVRDRAYYAQPVWKRIVVIAAGPAVNLRAGLRPAVRVLLADRPGDHHAQVAAVERGYPGGGRRAARRPARRRRRARRHARRSSRSGSRRTSARRSRRRRAARRPSRSTLTVVRDGSAGRSSSRRSTTRAGQAHAARLRATRRARATRSPSARASTRRPTRSGSSPSRRSRSRRGSSTPRSARRSPASSAPTRSRGRRS